MEKLILFQKNKKYMEPVVARKMESKTTLNSGSEGNYFSDSQLNIYIYPCI